MNLRKQSLIKSSGISVILAIMLAACQPNGGGTLGGKTATRTLVPKYGSENGEGLDGTVSPNPSTPTTVTEGSVTADPSTELEMQIDQPLVVDNDDMIVPPANVTGAYLFCYRDKVENNKATVFCATEDETTRKAFEPIDRYSKHEFSAKGPASLKVNQKALLPIHRYNVEFEIVANSSADLNRELSGMQYFFTATDFNNNEIKAESRPTTNVRPEMWIQSLKPENLPARCLDRWRMVNGAPPQPLQVVTTPCSLNQQTHSWYVTPQGKIAHVSTGECLAFDTADSLSVVRACDNAQAVQFDFFGEQIRIRNSNNCLGLINADRSGVDYPATVACNGNDNTQRWRISPQAQR